MLWSDKQVITGNNYGDYYGCEYLHLVHKSLKRSVLRYLKILMKE